jgi:hypothetical protein
MRRAASCILHEAAYPGCVDTVLPLLETVYAVAAAQNQLALSGARASKISKLASL